MSFTRQQIADQCRASAGWVEGLPDGVDAATLLWALSGVESSFGANVTPRHEPAFDVGGALAGTDPMPALLAKFGSAAACSYGPWQLMFCNAPAGSAPGDFDSLGIAATYTVRFLNAQLARRQPQNYDEIGEMWNTGRIKADPNYVAALEKCLAIEMPEPATA